MSSVTITSFFTKSGVPVTDIHTTSSNTFPVVRIWEADTEVFVGEFLMSPIEDLGSPSTTNDGLYKFEFSNIDGYNNTVRYTIRTDGGPTLLGSDRYQSGIISPEVQFPSIPTANDIADAVWDEPRIDHLQSGSTGEALSLIKTDTTNIADKLYVDADSVLDVVHVLLKMEAGRTKIDTTAKTLTVYDEDCSTPLRVFQLLDSSGTPSSTEVCERKPITKGAGDTTTITDVCP